MPKAKQERAHKRYLTASERVVRELRSKVNLCLLQKVFVPWKPEEFGRIDNMDNVFKNENGK